MSDIEVYHTDDSDSWTQPNYTAEEIQLLLSWKKKEELKSLLRLPYHNIMPSSRQVKKPKLKRTKGINCKSGLHYAIAARNRRCAEQKLGKLLETTEGREITDEELEQWDRAERWIIDTGIYNNIINNIYISLSN